jgi:hypothetical protein
MSRYPSSVLAAAAQLARRPTDRAAMERACTALQYMTYMITLHRMPRELRNLPVLATEVLFWKRGNASVADSV